MKFYFAPDQDCLTPLLKVISSAKRYILVADYSFNSPDVTAALIAKHQAGIPVRMVLDKSQSHGKTEMIQLARLMGMDYVIGTSDKHQIMHLKVLVADDTVAFGSYNFTTNAASQDNVLAVTTDKQTALEFSAQIQKVYDWIKSNQLIERNVMDYRDVAVRALKTGGQAFVAALVASAAGWASLPELSVAKKVLLAAFVAGVSAAWNVVLVPAVAKLGLGK